jgi:hypothetical protein
VLPCAGTVPMLLWALLASGQIRRIRPVCLPCLRDGVGDSVHH